MLSFDERDHIIREWCDGQEPSVSLALWSFKFIAIASFMTYKCSYDMRLCNSRIPEEHFVCYQTSQRKWVIIKVLYRCLRRCLLGWHRSRLDLSLRVSERYLWALSVILITISLASIVTNELVAGWCITERVKRLAGNEIELGLDTDDRISGK